MNPILLILALLFLIPIIREIRIFILIKWYSKKVVGQIISIKSKDTFTRNLSSLIQGGDHRLIKISYQFIFAGKKREVLNDKVHVSASSYFNKLKNGGNINIYIYSKNNEIKNTWLLKTKFWHLVPYLILFLTLLLVSYLSADIYYVV